MTLEPRWRRLAALALFTLFAVLIPVVALAQGVPPLIEPVPDVAPTAVDGGLDWRVIVGMIFSGLVGVFGVAYGVVQKMAARPALDGWDEAKIWMDRARSGIEWVAANRDKVESATGVVIDWNDPESANVPRSPQNPMGVATREGTPPASG